MNTDRSWLSHGSPYRVSDQYWQKVQVQHESPHQPSPHRRPATMTTLAWQQRDDVYQRVTQGLATREDYAAAHFRTFVSGFLPHPSGVLTKTDLMSPSDYQTALGFRFKQSQIAPLDKQRAILDFYRHKRSHQMMPSGKPRRRVMLERLVKQFTDKINVVDRVRDFDDDMLGVALQALAENPDHKRPLGTLLTFNRSWQKPIEDVSTAKRYLYDFYWQHIAPEFLPGVASAVCVGGAHLILPDLALIPTYLRACSGQKDRAPFPMMIVSGLIPEHDVALNWMSGYDILELPVVDTKFMDVMHDYEHAVLRAPWQPDVADKALTVTELKFLGAIHHALLTLAHVRRVRFSEFSSDEIQEIKTLEHGFDMANDRLGFLEQGIRSQDEIDELLRRLRTKAEENFARLSDTNPKEIKTLKNLWHNLTT